MKRILIGLAAIAACLFAASCNDKLDIRQGYDFSLSSWYIQSSIEPNEEVEIRFYLDRTGNWNGAEYRIGYVQIEGRGEVYDDDGVRLVNREMHRLAAIPGLDTQNPNRYVFTLFYRNLSEKRAEVKFIVTDNFGAEREQTVKFTPTTAVAERK